MAPRDIIIGTKGQSPNLTTKGGGDTNAQHLSRVAFKTGPNPVADLRVVNANFYMPGSGAGEAGVGNAITISQALEGNGYGGRQFFYGGASTLTMPDKSGLFISDPLPEGIVAPYSVLEIRTLLQVTAGQFWPLAAINGTTTAAVKAASGLDSQLLSSGAPSGGTAEAGVYGPIAVIGRTLDGVAVVFPGCSLEDGTGDTKTSDVDGVIGYIARGLINVNGNPIPHSKVTMGSEKILQLADPLTGRFRLSATRYGTDLVVGALQTNDIVAGTTLANIQAATQKVWAVGRANGCRVWQCNMPPRCTGAFSAGAALAAASQTIVSNFGTGSIAEQCNQWFAAQVGQGLLDGVFDNYSLCVDPANPWKWRSDVISSVDGTHFTQPQHILIGSAFSAFAAANFN